MRDYSFRFFGGSPLHGITADGYVDFGPSITVLDGGPQILGGRASVAVDGHAGDFCFGMEVVYRGGVPMGNGAQGDWQSAPTWVLRLGAVFDVPRR
jgi:hypothetical protein